MPICLNLFITGCIVDLKIDKHFAILFVTDNQPQLFNNLLPETNIEKFHLKVYEQFRQCLF